MPAQIPFLYKYSMFIPLGDDNRRRRIIPFVNYGLIGLNAYVWYLQLTLGETFTASYAAIPLELTQGTDITATQYITVEGDRVPIPQGPGPHPLWITIFTAMFMHGSWMHLIGNMVYLAIFGDQVEDRLGHVRFLTFYLFAGVVATLTQVYADPTSIIPSIGASGAIAGVLGAYLVLYPQNGVKVLLIREIVIVPASLVLGMWALFQFLGQASVQHGQGGVAYMAHIGGFVAGFATGAFLRVARSPQRGYRFRR
jgi:membrane associated rhomboid family serine protease